MPPCHAGIRTAFRVVRKTDARCSSKAMRPCLETDLRGQCFIVDAEQGREGVT